MVPIEQIFQNMGISHTKSLYTRAEIEKWRIARQKVAHPKGGNTRGHTEVDFDCLLKPSLQVANDTHNVDILDREGGKPSPPHQLKPESEDHPDDPDESLFESRKPFYTPNMNGPVNVKVYPTQFRRLLILFALGLSMFLVRSQSRLVSRVTNEFARPKTLSLRRFHT
jgi:hypothetical protein